MPKKPYEKPAIVQTDKLTTRAILCVKNNDAQCGGGPINS